MRTGRRICFGLRQKGRPRHLIPHCTAAQRGAKPLPAQVSLRWLAALGSLSTLAPNPGLGSGLLLRLCRSGPAHPESMEPVVFIQAWTSRRRGLDASWPAVRGEGPQGHRERAHGFPGGLARTQRSRAVEGGTGHRQAQVGAEASVDLAAACIEPQGFHLKLRIEQHPRRLSGLSQHILGAKLVAEATVLGSIGDSEVSFEDGVRSRLECRSDVVAREAGSLDEAHPRPCNRQDDRSGRALRPAADHRDRKHLPLRSGKRTRHSTAAVRPRLQERHTEKKRVRLERRSTELSDQRMGDPAFRYMASRRRVPRKPAHSIGGQPKSIQLLKLNGKTFHVWRNTSIFGVV